MKELGVIEFTLVSAAYYGSFGLMSVFLFLASSFEENIIYFALGCLVLLVPPIFLLGHLVQKRTGNKALLYFSFSPIVMGALGIAHFKFS